MRKFSRVKYLVFNVALALRLVKGTKLVVFNLLLLLQEYLRHGKKFRFLHRCLKSSKQEVDNPGS